MTKELIVEEFLITPGLHGFTNTQTKFDDNSAERDESYEKSERDADSANAVFVMSFVLQLLKEALSCVRPSLQE